MCYPGWVGGFMSWKKQRRLQGKNKYYSLAKKLRLENEGGTREDASGPEGP